MSNKKNTFKTFFYFRIGYATYLAFFIGITNLLTTSYFQQVQDWVTSVTRGEFPVRPTTDELRIQFNDLEKFKMVSDEIVWHSAKFKLLFGEGAEEELRSQFKVIKVEGTTLTDNEIKQTGVER